jgi:hypothetical protein
MFTKNKKELKIEIDKLTANIRQLNLDGGEVFFNMSDKIKISESAADYMNKIMSALNHAHSASVMLSIELSKDEIITLTLPALPARPLTYNKNCGIIK